MANPYGLYDMHGNVWEWVQDHWKGKLPGGRDPLVNYWSDLRASRDHVVRGGSWRDIAKNMRSAERDFYDLGYKSGYLINWLDAVGFRLVRNL